MEPVKINIGKGWTPDFSSADITRVGGLKTATNIVRSSGYYWPVVGKREFNSTALAGTPKSGFSCQSTASIMYNFAGTTTKLYAFNGTSMVDATRAAGPYTGQSWQFATYGDWLVATNYVDAIQLLEGVSLGLSGTKFADLTGTTFPSIKAKYLCMNQGHLILGYLNEAGTENFKKIRWCALENIKDWVESVSTGADHQQFPEMDGNITGIANVGKDFAVFSDNSITTGYFIGGQYVYGFNQNVIKNIGCAFPKTLISIGDACYFWSKKSIYKLTAAGPEDIGIGIKNTVFSELNTAAAENMSVTHDVSKGIIYWHYPVNGSASSSIPSKVLIYNYIENVFTTADLAAYFLMMGYFGETLVDNISLTVDSIDDYARSVDSPYWKGNSVALMACNDVDKKMQTITGPNLMTEIETGEIDAGEAVVSVTKIQVPIEGVSMSGNVQIKSRYSGVQAQTIHPSGLIRQDATIDVRVTNRRFSAALQLSNFDRLGNTITFDTVPSGGR